MNRPMNIRHYAALAATVRHGSLTRAARAVNLTQPALTQAIRGLEATLETTLFERRADGMHATKAGELLAARAEAAISRIGSPRVTGTQLRAFLALARAGSFAGASNVTGLSPASLHRAVADLSISLGHKLIERRGKGVVLTTAGDRCARQFGLAMAELRAGLAEIAMLQGKAGVRIAIGAMPLSRARWLPEAITQFAAAHPNVDIAIHEGSYAELAGPLRDGDIDLVLGALREESEIDDLVQEAVFEDHPAIVMRADHPLLGARDRISAMLDYSWMLSSRTTPLRRYWEEMIRTLGYDPPHVVVECGSVMMLRQLLFGGNGLTLLSRDQVAVELEAGILAAIDPPVSIIRTIGIITRAGWWPTAVHSQFLEFLRKNGRGP